jgi:hypothetical protein
MNFTTKLAPLALAAAFVFSTAAQAAVTVYTDQASFLAAVSNPGVDTFNDISSLGSTPSPLFRVAGPHSYTATSQLFFGGSLGGGDNFLSTNTATDTMTFSGFSAGVSAIGGEFFGSDISGAFAAVGSISLVIDTGDSESIFTIANPTATSFFGIVSTTGLVSFTVLSPTVDGGPPFFWPSANNLVLAELSAGPAIPEPASWALMIAGFGLVGAAARRRAAVAA